jgi:hypothetical protein
MKRKYETDWLCNHQEMTCQFTNLNYESPHRLGELLHKFLLTPQKHVKHGRQKVRQYYILAEYGTQPPSSDLDKFIRTVFWSWQIHTNRLLIELLTITYIDHKLLNLSMKAYPWVKMSPLRASPRVSPKVPGRPVERHYSLMRCSTNNSLNWPVREGPA